jgi:hypothetical protein
MEREEKVAAGELTREQAEQESEEWQEVSLHSDSLKPLCDGHGLFCNVFVAMIQRVKRPLLKSESVYALLRVRH